MPFFLFAYIDPGAGALVLQAIAAAVLTTGYVLRRYLTAPFTFFGSSWGKKMSPEQVDEGD